MALYVVAKVSENFIVQYAGGYKRQVSETLITFYKITRCHTPEDHNPISLIRSVLHIFKTPLFRTLSEKLLITQLVNKFPEDDGLL